jgi:hypothetical protein
LILFEYLRLKIGGRIWSFCTDLGCLTNEIYVGFGLHIPASVSASLTDATTLRFLAGCETDAALPLLFRDTTTGTSKSESSSLSSSSSSKFTLRELVATAELRLLRLLRRVV